jgi:hypothetical protein
LLWGNWFQHILFLQRWNVVQKLAAPTSSSVRASSRGATTPLYGLNQSGVCNELLHRNGTLMQDLRQHAGVTGRRAIGAIIGPCRCSDHSAYYNQMRTHLAFTIKCVRIWL